MKFLAWMVLLTACAGSSGAMRDSVPAGSASVPTGDTVRVLAELQSSGWGEREIAIIEDSASLAPAWARLHANGSDKPEMPRVDFSAERVIVAAGGTKPSGGHVMVPGSMRRAGDTVVVDVTLQTPGPQCGATAAITEPVIMFTIPRTPSSPRITITERAGPAC